MIYGFRVFGKGEDAGDLKYASNGDIIIATDLQIAKSRAKDLLKSRSVIKVEVVELEKIENKKFVVGRVVAQLSKDDVKQELEMSQIELLSKELGLDIGELEALSPEDRATILVQLREIKKKYDKIFSLTVEAREKKLFFDTEGTTLEEYKRRWQEVQVQKANILSMEKELEQEIETWLNSIKSKYAHIESFIRTEIGLKQRRVNTDEKVKQRIIEILESRGHISKQELQQMISYLSHYKLKRIVRSMLDTNLIIERNDELLLRR